MQPRFSNFHLMETFFHFSPNSYQILPKFSRTVRTFFNLIAILAVTVSFFSTAQTASASPSTAAGMVLTVLDRNGQTITSFTDGDEIRLNAKIPENANKPFLLSFQMDGAQDPVGKCVIASGSASCETNPISTLGWGWDSQGQQVKNHHISVFQGEDLQAAIDVGVKPRPVIMVHGFISNWEAWKNYLGPDGYLASIGLPGYAVGDGQAPGTLNTGSLSQPASRTNTIAENASILKDYIAGVKKATGAQKVDLLVHSMGGLISRYYIDRLMPEGEVAQLIMLGSPMAGSACADLPASLGFYLPASLEIQPSYVQGIFNQQIIHRHGVPFYDLAGTEITDPIKSPCTQVPTDLAVSLESVKAVPLHVSEMPVLHTDLNTSSQVFNQFVKPLLQSPPGGFPVEPDPPVPTTAMQPLQFTHIFTGHVDLGQNPELVINIEPGVSVASFALFDDTHSLDVRVLGASGKEITLGPDNLVKVEDPTALFYLGYGFNNPKPGAWKVTLLPTASTPAGGADYALTASFEGGAVLNASTGSLLPQVGAPK